MEGKGPGWWNGHCFRPILGYKCYLFLGTVRKTVYVLLRIYVISCNLIQCHLRQLICDFAANGCCCCCCCTTTKRSGVSCFNIMYVTVVFVFFVFFSFFTGFKSSVLAGGDVWKVVFEME